MEYIAYILGALLLLAVGAAVYYRVKYGKEAAQNVLAKLEMEAKKAEGEIKAKL